AGLLMRSGRATTAPEVSAISEPADIVLVTCRATCAGAARAAVPAPALDATVFTRTGFIGSDEPGMIASGWLEITPLVSGAGSILDSVGRTSGLLASGLCG